MTKERPTALVVGGTSGLGLELALLLARTHRVVVTGRHDPRNMSLTFWYLNLSSYSSLVSGISHSLDELVEQLPGVDLFVHAAGFDEHATIGDLNDKGIMDTLSVGLIAPAMLLQRLLRKQKSLGGFIAITSTSQKIPRLHEPIYCASKAGLAMLANCVAMDAAVGRVLVAAPSGMNTPFWRNRPRADAQELLDPKWVAKQVLNEYEADDYTKFKMVSVLRNPPHVQVEERR